MAHTDPATLAARLIAEFPDGNPPITPARLRDDDAEITAVLSRLLTQVEDCARALDVSGNNIGAITRAMPTLWACAAYRRRFPGADDAVAVLEAISIGIRHAGLAPNPTAVAIGIIRQALEDLEDLVGGDPEIPDHLRHELLARIRDAREACDHMDDVGAVSLNERIDKLIASTLRAAGSSKDPDGVHRFVAIARQLLTATAYGLPLEAISQATQIAIGG